MEIGKRQSNILGMKVCKKPGCPNPVTRAQMAYCSKDCAPLGHLSGVDSWSETTDAFSSKERGEASEPTYDLRKIKMRARGDDSARIRNIESELWKADESIMKSTENNTHSETEPTIGIKQTNGEKSNPDFASNDPEKTQRDMKNTVTTFNDATQLIDYIGQSSNSKEASLQAPMNLLDDSILLLHGLLKSAGEKYKTQIHNPDHMQAICNCAKNLRELMKLKLEIYRSYSKNN